MEEPLLAKLQHLRQFAEVSLAGLGALLGLFGLGQSSAYHKHNLLWAEIDYFLQVRQVHIETLNNMREDLRDMYEMDGRKLDTNMIIATLLLGIGFGFVVEGTFPGEKDKQHSEIYQAQQRMRVLYAIVAALALLCPFWSMLALMECRRRLDFFMNEFNDKFYRMLKHRFHMFIAETRSADILHNANLVRYTAGLPEEPMPSLGRVYTSPFRCPPRRQRSGSRRKAPPRREGEDTEEGFHTPGDFGVILALHSHYASWRFHWCLTCQRVASVCTWFAMLFNVLCCSILLGMSFQYSYPDTPEMWMWYSYLVLLGLLLALVLSALAQYTGPRLGSNQKENITSMPIPDWMKEEPEDNTQPLL
mmetsp:Transcript_104100/g.303938  ORF Transcript_104100/g.303938 Transcript_104100/m.303938 type:complete len:361 (-) Transcript_104100:104-1186(-)